VYGAATVINITGNQKSDGLAAEYRFRRSNCSAYHYDLSLTYLNEGDSRVARRNGFSAQLWPMRSDALDHMEVALGVVAYWFIDRRRPVIPGKGPTGSVAPVVSVMFSYVPHREGWFARLIWDRVVSNYNRDADIWRLGVGHTM
jgi:hypothetical protein